MDPSVAIKGIYESTVNDIENLYKEVVDEKKRLKVISIRTSCLLKKEMNVVKGSNNEGF